MRAVGWPDVCDQDRLGLAVEMVEEAIGGLERVLIPPRLNKRRGGVLGQGGDDLGGAEVAALVAQVGIAQFLTGSSFGATQFPHHRGEVLDGWPGRS